MKKNPRWVEFLREQFPPSTRIRLVQMSDPYSPIEPGSLGTVEFIDDQCTLHMLWDNGRTLGLIPGVDRFSIVQQALKSLKLYMPLTIECYERNEWGDFDNDPIEIDNHTATLYEDSILAALIRERLPEEKERGIMHWYHGNDSINEKVRSAMFSIENIQGHLWGTVECEIMGDLTTEEMKAFKDYVAGQASDGWGEGFEQRPIRTISGEIYVHLWSGEENWQIYTEDEFQSMQSQQMRGLSM